MSEIVYRMLSKDTLQEQVHLYNKVFHQCIRTEAWHRKHYENPLIRTNTVVGAYFAEKLIGINGFIPMAFEMNEVAVAVAQSSDSAVDPEYRGRKVFQSMVLYAEKYLKENEYEYLIGFPNDNSIKGLLNIGWVEKTKYRKMDVPKVRLRRMKQIQNALFRSIGLESSYMSKNFAVAAVGTVQNTARFTIKAYSADEYFAHRENTSENNHIMRQRINISLLEWMGCFNKCEYISVIQDQQQIASYIVSQSTNSKYVSCKLILDEYINEQFGTNKTEIRKTVLRYLLSSCESVSFWDTPRNDSMPSGDMIRSIHICADQQFIVKSIGARDTNQEIWNPQMINADYMNDWK